MNTSITYRVSTEPEIPRMARLRAEQYGRGSEHYWEERIEGYLQGKANPRQALGPRIIYVAAKDENIVGFIAGHLTKRFGCDGELQWINVGLDYRGMGIASRLLQQLAAWFVNQKAFNVCVNCAPDNTAAQIFYQRHGARQLSEHWLIWENIMLLL